MPMLIGRFVFWGDFVLQPQNARHRVATNDWLGMSAEQRHKAVKACFRIQSAGATVTSTDGSIAVPSTPRGENKPGQRKRVRNVRTQSRLFATGLLQRRSSGSTGCYTSTVATSSPRRREVGKPDYCSSRLQHCMATKTTFVRNIDLINNCKNLPF